MDHNVYMQRAAELSASAIKEQAGGPFGAVIVRGGEIIAEGSNRVTIDNDPTAHAEVVAIRNAAKALGSFDLSGCELYTSCEPCPMCFGAIYWARLDHVYYANTRQDAAAIGFDDKHIYDEISAPIDQHSIPFTHLPSTEARDVFAQWQANTDLARY